VDPPNVRFVQFSAWSGRCIFSAIGASLRRWFFFVAVV
jgi:hypothetical protein